MDIANVHRIDTNVKEAVIKEFYEECQAQNYISEGGLEYAAGLLEKAVGSERAAEILNRLTSSLAVRPFDHARKSDPNQILNFIQNEHPQTIALILAYLEPTMAAEILSKLSVEKQTEVAARISTMDRTNPEYVREIERVLDKKLSSVGAEDYTSVGGIGAIVDILNATDRSTERRVLEKLALQDVGLADEIRSKMFVFEDIVKLGKQDIQCVIRAVDKHDLTIALKSAAEAVKEVVFENMSKRMGESIREDMELMGPVRLKGVEEAQQKIVSVIRKLQEEDKIVISRDTGDEMVG